MQKWLSSVTTPVHLISCWASFRSRLKQLCSVYRDVPPTIAVGKTWCSSYQKFSRQNWVECRIQSQDLFTCFLFKSKIHTEFFLFLRGAKVSWLFPPFFFSLMQCCRGASAALPSSAKVQCAVQRYSGVKVKWVKYSAVTWKWIFTFDTPSYWLGDESIQSKIHQMVKDYLLFVQGAI